VKTIGGSGLDYANAALTCMNNDIVLTGKFTATVDFDPGASIYNLYGTGNSMFIAKIDSNGNFIWAKQIGQPDGGETFSIATDLQNNIYTTGHYFYSGPADFDPSVNNYYLSSNDGSAVDIFISKIDINGNFMAAYSIDCHTNYDASSYSIIVDSFSNIFITGVLIDSITFDSTGLVTLYASGPGDIFIAKYSQCNSSSTFSSASSCDSFYWEKSNLYYSASGLYYHYGVNSMGCLVVDSLSLTINHPTTATYNQTSCSTYFWPVSQLTYAQSGLYTYATIDSITGCSIFHELNLEVKPQPTVVSPGNQNYCNGQSVAAIPLSGSPANVVFDISGGAARGMPNQLNTLQLPAFVAGPSGTSVVTLLPHANGCTGNAVTYNLAVSNCPPLTLNLKFYIQGYYTSNGYMQNVLYNEGVSSEPLSVNCDYVIVELHSAQAPYAMIKTTIATLKTNGTLQCNFPGSVTNTPFYIVVHHRNTLTTWSHAPVMMTSGVFYNFSDQASKAYGDNQLEMEPGIFAFFNGDLNQEENIDLLDATILEADVFDFVSGYYDSDLNGDGNTDLLDVPILDMNMFNFVYAQHP
ncbi:MAG TPA: hypothetical protein PLP14_07740, partial [Chitinophagaceae bacterium]|nr:hypothetical protein [Chitinophagaceae bacterium]